MKVLRDLRLLSSSEIGPQLMVGLELTQICTEWELCCLRAVSCVGCWLWLCVNSPEHVTGSGPPATSSGLQSKLIFWLC